MVCGLKCFVVFAPLSGAGYERPFIREGKVPVKLPTGNASLWLQAIVAVPIILVLGRHDRVMGILTTIGIGICLESEWRRGRKKKNVAGDKNCATRSIPGR